MTLKTKSPFDFAKVKNLTVGEVPPGNTSLVVAPITNLGLSNKLKKIFAGFDADIQYIENPGRCPEDEVATVPKDMLRTIQQGLQRVNSCVSSVYLLNVLIENLLNKTGEYVNIPREFFELSGRVFDDLKLVESNSVISASLAKIATGTVSTRDIQTLPRNEILAGTLEHENKITDDTNFNNDKGMLFENEESLKLTDVLKTTLDESPMSLGLGGSTLTNPEIEVDPELYRSDIPIVDSYDSQVVGEAARGLIDLYDARTLTVPIKSLRIFDGYENGTPYIYIHGWETIGENELYARKKIVLNGLDVNRSLIDQDWAVKAVNETMTIDNALEVYSAQDISMYGLMTRKTYKVNEVKGLKDALKGIWTKMKNIKLPSPEHINAGIKIISAGLKIGGEIAESSSLVSIGNILESFTDDPSSLFKGVSQRENLRGEQVNYGVLPKVMLNIMPNLSIAGLHVIQKNAVSRRQLTLNAEKESSRILSAYGEDNEELDKVFLRLGRYTPR